MTEQPGTWMVPGYVAEELIGFGGSGEVWRGRAMDTAETVALKRLRAGAADHARRRLEREAALLATIDHPHLLRVRELVSTERETVLVLDYAACGSLAMLLRRRGRLRPGEVVTVLAPVAVALAHAHDEGLIHGDVSPANVLFTAAGRPLLADLGVARVLGERDDAQCTPEYIDPAVAAGAAPGPASDVFMVAAVAVHALTGAPPWRADSPEGAVALAATAPVLDLSRTLQDVPERLIDALQRALSPDPSERGSAAELALDMRHACTPEPVRLVPPPQLLEDSSSSGADASGALTHAVRMQPAEPPAASDSASAGVPRHRRDRRRPAAAAPPGMATPQPVAVRGSRSRSARRAVAFAVALLLAILLGVSWGSAGLPEWPADLAAARDTAPRHPAAVAPTGRTPRPRTAPAARGPAPAESDERRWLAVLGALDRVRAQAYERGDAALLGEVYLPGRHLRADSAQLAVLTSAGDTVRGVRHRLGSLDVLVRSEDHVRLRVVQSLPPAQRLHGGRAVAVIPGTPASAVLVDLVATPAGWRLA
jgi:hypothetical protein